MDKQNRKSALILTSVGIFIVSLSLLIWDLMKLPDYVIGTFMGIGIGLLILAIIKGKIKPVSR